MMDHDLFKEELKTTIAAFALQAEALPCFELKLPDPGTTIAVIATLIDAGLALPDTMEPRLCERCGAWHARRIERNV